MIVRPAELADHQEWLSMRMVLWPDCPADEHAAEMRAYAGAGESQMAFVADVGFVCGFVEASLRPTAEGCTTSPVGCIEGIYVKPDDRRHGARRALITAAERWAALFTLNPNCFHLDFGRQPHPSTMKPSLTTQIRR